VQFDTTRNRFSETSDEFQIKFWDMDNNNILTTIDVEGSSTLQASPRLRFSKDDSLLTVTTNNNGIKILANAEGLRLIRMLENNRAFEGTRVPPDTMATKASIVNFMPPAVTMTNLNGINVRQQMLNQGF